MLYRVHSDIGSGSTRVDPSSLEAYRRAAANGARAPIGTHCDPEAPRDESVALWKLAHHLPADWWPR